MGAIVRRQLVGYEQLAEHPEYIEQPELRQLEQRFDRHVARHERPIERERRLVGHEQFAGHLQQPELWHEHHVPEHERSIELGRRELRVAGYEQSIERYDERRAAELLELRQQHEVSSAAARASCPRRAESPGTALAREA